ncbi:pdf-1 [Pristionchus pacificus]|uniref:Pdf-1 n=1 Tax=Pristionchus pacificus TaxID=54126 RepID=A0A454Y6N0_PRIPA|nr:pdf-1 [Pristionchus pacificus]|eukprot:PDM81975.1 pdf-1 [Pristionchus pacificus]
MASFTSFLVLLLACIALSQAAYFYPRDLSDYPMPMHKRSNAELINGLIGMDLGKLSAVGKRSNAELINGLLGMNLNKLSSAGRR